MSERMTDEVFEGRVQTEPNTRVALSIAYVEAVRARASEEQKEAVIKALADALEEAPEGFDGYAERRIAALRLAGRL